MAQFPALPIWTDALLGDTQHLSTAEFGAYVLLLIIAWRDPDCSLPDDDKVLARLTRSANNWHRIRESVMRFWTHESDGRYRQKRLTQERLRVLKSYSRKASNLRKNHKTDSTVGSATISISRKKEDIDPVLHLHPVKETTTESRLDTARGGGEKFEFHERFGEVSRKVEELVASRTSFPFVRSPIDKWLKAGADPEADIYPAILSKLDQWEGRKLGFFDYAVADAMRARTSPMPTGRGPGSPAKFDPAAELRRIRESEIAEEKARGAAQ